MDPESFVRGDPTLTKFFLVDEGREDLSTTIRWRADGGPTLNAGLVAVLFQGIKTCIARKHYIFVIFQGGSRPPAPPPPSDPHMGV